jgi:threonine/homoserine/homoserine lactone efflux protein
MTTPLMLALCLFALVSSITPGPNNMMILASGVHFGVRRSLAHLLGISLGFGFMILVVGMGLQTVLAAYPMILTVLRYVGAAYLLWLAYKLATATPTSLETSRPHQPMGFGAACAFQWVNPKAWVMAITALSTYLPPNPSLWQVALLTAIFTAVNLPAVTTWLVFGSAMRSLLQSPQRMRIFNWSMALALVASLAPLLSP